MLELRSPRNNEAVCLQTDEQKNFLAEEDRRAALDGALTFRWYDLEKQGIDRSQPQPVTFVWEEVGEEISEDIADACLLVSEYEDMRGAWVYVTEGTSCEVYNLKVGIRYFWCVQKNGRRSEVSAFRTLPRLPRTLKIDYISNVRDIGGYKVEGGAIRQGLVYRGGEFELHMHLTEAGMKELTRLGIRTELDMRGEAKDKVDHTTAEVIGIRRVYVPSVPYTKVFNEEQGPAIKAFFETFTDPCNYPIYFHCWGGADRAGTFAFILGAFLGMRYEDLINEYEFTSLSIWKTRSRNYGEFRQFTELFLSLPGETMHQKGEAFLKEHAGLTDGQLAAIYDMLVDRAGRPDISE